MPLYSPREFFRRMIERLYQPVGRICHRAKLKRKITNPLVMIAVYLERGGFEHCTQRSIWHQRNLMPIPIIRTFHAVRNCRRHLRGDVLIQRSPQRSIDELGPAAYSEQRHIPVQCLRKQGALQFIAPGAQLATSGVGAFLVQGRIHIIATREQNAIAFLCHKSGIERRKWKNNGQRTANRKSLEIARYHPYAFTCIVVQRSNAYQTRPQTAQRH